MPTFLVVEICVLKSEVDTSDPVETLLGRDWVSCLHQNVRC